ncbi:hypothetical protein M404DRAFT_1000372 [Pisolithus tinctorius Marx 270]|uniref:Uncharacterized protein n=1 Tax=Pisolithus tinctorius Marx 270 TaxID=870435 RepID=A0A0C3K5M5_PISTI|nr:hypothetical protein M404DRAFT_1000372 [Pisolithus tinctorius Marx 270]
MTSSTGGLTINLIGITGNATSVVTAPAQKVLESKDKTTTSQNTLLMPGISVDVAKDLKEIFTWVPPLIAQSDKDLAGPEAISLDEIDAFFSAFESEVAEGEGHESISGRGVVKGQVYSFKELDQVDKGLTPQGVDEVIEVVDHSQQDDRGWDATLLMLVEWC